MRRFIIILVLAGLISGCNTYSPDEVLLPRADISMTEKGRTVVDFDQSSFQEGFNDSRNEYRAYDDRLSKWFVIRCSQMPVAEGQEVTADVEWKGKNSSGIHNQLLFTVEKANAEKIWMWNKSNRIGIIIKNII